MAREERRGTLSQEPPRRPWKKGSQEGYRCGHLGVRVVEDDQGWVFSDHDFLTAEDVETFASMQGYGVKQIAYALLTEAVRREMYLCLLAEMTKHPDTLKWFREGDETFQEVFLRRLNHGALATIMNVVQKMLPGVAREVVEMALAQEGGSCDDPGE